MPEFVLDMGSPKGARMFAALDDFTQGYVEAAFFTETGSLDDADRDLEHASVAEIDPASLEQVKADCAAWQQRNASTLALAYASSDDYGPKNAGRDYWFTRNGHGVGFWDRGQLRKVIVGKNNETNLADVLSERCRHQERCLYRGDDDRIYFE